MSKNDYRRKTVDEYTLQGKYSGSWEDLTSEATKTAIGAQLKCYIENEPGTEYRIVLRRVSKATGLQVVPTNGFTK